MKWFSFSVFVLMVSIIIAGFTNDKPIEKVDLERNKTVIKKFLQAYIDVDLNTIDKLTDRSYKQYYFDEFQENYDGLISTLKQKGKAGECPFHDIIAEGDQVLIRYTANYPPAEFKGVDLFTVRNGKVIEGRFFYKQSN